MELGRIKSLLPFREMAYKMMCGISSQLCEHRLRTKYNDIEKAKLAYRKQRKHTHKQTRKMRVHPDEELLNDKQLDMLETITRIYRQQKNHFKSGDSRESIPNRIVSVSKPYIRPIVRGKETKTEALCVPVRETERSAGEEDRWRPGLLRKR